MNQKTNKETKSTRVKPGSEVVKQEDILTAILVADSFSNRFGPLTENQPKALIPLVNRPMIEYCLESLLLSGVQKTYVYCVSHADQIRQYLKNSKWVQSFSPMSVEALSQSSADCHSLGDALRDIEGKGLIRGDFIILSTDVVTNVQLKPILEKHRERKKMDKGLIMTHVFKKLFCGHRDRTSDEELVLAINSETGRILHYQLTAHVKKLNFPLEIFKENNPVHLRYDLVDTHISVCSNAVLPLFADNFDYQTWSDFVRGILISEEILGNTIYCYELEGYYAAQVKNVSMYDAVSKDIIQRWTCPLVPDLSTGNGVLRHVLSRHNVYKQSGVTLGKGSLLESDVVIGESTSIGEETFVSHSVIGRHCIIGNCVSVRNAYIWENVTIKDKCRIDLAIIANDVVLEENVELGRGCILGPGVRLACGTKVPSNTRLTAQPSLKSDKNQSCRSAEFLLPGSKAYEYVNKNDDEDSDVESLINDIWDLNVEEETDDEENEEHFESGEDDSEEFDEDMPEDENVKSFYTEVLESLQRGFEEKIKGENLVLEINSSKYAYNVTMEEVNTLVMKAILSLPSLTSKQTFSESKEYLTTLLPILKHFLPVLRNYLKTDKSQLECLHAVDDFGIHHKYFNLAVGKVLHYLYEQEVLYEEVILKWYANPPNDPSANTTVRKFATQFIEWLKNADEETDEDD